MVTETADGDTFPKFGPSMSSHQRGDNGLQSNPVQGIAGMGLGL